MYPFSRISFLSTEHSQPERVMCMCLCVCARTCACVHLRVCPWVFILTGKGAAVGKGSASLRMSSLYYYSHHCMKLDAPFLGVRDVSKRRSCWLNGGVSPILLVGKHALPKLL